MFNWNSIFGNRKQQKPQQRQTDFSEAQKKVETSKNRITVHVGDLWKLYGKQREEAKNEWQFRKHDVGRKGHTYRITVNPPLANEGWQTYAWSFPRGTDGVVKKDRRLHVYDDEMLKILLEVQGREELKGYKIVPKV